MYKYIFLHYHTKVFERNYYICISTVALNISKVKKIFRILQKMYILDKMLYFWTFFIHQAILKNMYHGLQKY